MSGQKVLLQMGLFLVVVLCFSNLSMAQDARPNILVIITDQQAASAMSAAGNPNLNTPAIDSIAARGVRFERAYVTQPLCLPSRSSMMTGRYPHEIGSTTNGRPFSNDWPMVGKLMANSGYECGYVGKWHVGAPMDRERAGLSYIAAKGKDHEKTERAIEYLSREHSNPFFLTVSYINPHNVCQLARHQELPDGPIPPLPKNMDDLPPLPDNFAFPENEPSAIREVQAMSPNKHYPTADWDERLWREYLWGYYRICEKMDAEVAQLLQALKENGLSDETVIIFVSDHGEGIAAHHWNQKQILYESAVRVPFIVAPPETHAAGNVSNQLVSTGIDYLPTLLDFAGVSIPETMPGHSLKPIALGESDSLSREYVVAETVFASGTNEFGVSGRMLRTDRYKYIIYNRGDQREQLFDMENDSGETVNLAVRQEHAGELDKHRQLLEEWAIATNDVFPYVNK
ncbi:MAG: sulfatase-like hydrolase/transferase [Candidatus Hydrogenedentota bacterium]